MKKRGLILGLLSGVLSAALLFPQTSTAFWPFDGWSKKGEVKGEQTEISRPGLIRTIMQKVNPTPTTSTEELETELTEEKINKAVKGKVISEANKKLMLAKLAEIKKRREELKKLQEEFVAWMKANKIDPKMFENRERFKTSETNEANDEAEISETKVYPQTKTQRVTPTVLRPKAR